jgi:hypothetical protein
MAYRLIESGAYQRARESLNANAKVALPFALERIKDDPHHLRQRRRRPDGSIVDYGAVGLLIAYEILDSDRVRLLEIIDLKESHRWP